MKNSIEAASLAFVSDRSVLLIKRAFAPYAGRWTLPGGKLKPGETPELAVMREIEEELSLTPENILPVGVLEFSAAPVYRLAVFCAPAVSGSPSPSPEIADWRWCDLADIDGMNTTPGLKHIAEKAIALLARP